MSNYNTITVRVDSETKENATRIFKELGLDMSTGINIFLKQVVRTNGIPFPVSAERNSQKRNPYAYSDDELGKMSLDELLEEAEDN